MTPGGDIDSEAIKDAFSKIKEDMIKLNQELYDLKLEQKRLVEENIQLKSNTIVNQSQYDPAVISAVVQETLKSVKINSKNSNSPIVKRFNKKRKTFTMSKIVNLASQKNLSVSEIKDIVVDTEGLCSKATFYRYLTKLKIRGTVDTIRLKEEEILVSVQ
jgi:hypothetical protein